MSPIFYNGVCFFLFISITNLQVISGFNAVGLKGDVGQVSGSQDSIVKHSIGKRAGGYYGTGSKGSSSLVATSPSKSPSHFNEDDAYYGYKSSYHQPNKNHVQDLGNYLQFYESSDNLPADFGEMASASGHGGGHSTGYGDSGGGKGCNNALGLLGVLGLAAYLQSVLQQMKNATGRRRRSIVQEQMIKMNDKELKAFIAGNESDPNNKKSKSPEKVITGLLPLLSAVAHARDGLIPINCTYRQICHANAFLVESVGSFGRSLGALLSSEIGKLLIEVDRRRGPVILKSINKVAQLGRNGHDCNQLFEYCETLQYLPVYSMPPSLRFSTIPHRLLRMQSQQANNNFQKY